MPRKVKTLQIADLKARANKVFKTSENEYADGRRHIQTFVEHILMDTGNYRGFGYLGKDAVEAGKTFGVEFKPQSTGGIDEPIFHDQTRIEFF